MKLRKNDEVVVIAGSGKGTVGKILKIDTKKERVTVLGVNIVKKHQKPTQQNPDGGIKEFEAPIHISNVALATKGKDSAYTRVGYKKVDGKKVRIAKKTSKEI